MNELLMNVFFALAVAVFAFLIGAFPTAVVLGKAFYHKNPIEYGSHNSGGTNAGRVLGKKAGIIVIVVDITKTVLVFWSVFSVIAFSGIKGKFTLWLDGSLYTWMTLPFVALGHCYSPYLRFKGGKAVASLYGAIGGTSWVMFPLCFIVFPIVFKACKKVMSKASIFTGGILVLIEWAIAIKLMLLGDSFDGGFLTWTFGTVTGLSLGWESAVCISITYFLMVARHADNIRRIHAGKEKPLEWKSK